MSKYIEQVPTFKIEDLDGKYGQIQVGSDEYDGIKTVAVTLTDESGSVYVIDIKSYDLETGEEV